MPTLDKYKPNDPFSKLNMFLTEKLSPDDLAVAQGLVEELATELGGEPSASMATDAAMMLRDRVADGLARTRVAHAASLKTRFPNFGRLGRS